MAMQLGARAEIAGKIDVDISVARRTYDTDAFGS